MDYLPASCSLFCRFSQSYAKKLNPESPTMKRIRRAQLKKFSMIINIIAILLSTKTPTGQMLQFFPSISLCIKRNCKLFVGLKRWRWVKKKNQKPSWWCKVATSMRATYISFFSSSLFLSITLLLLLQECIRLSHDIDFQHKKHPPPTRPMPSQQASTTKERWKEISPPLCRFRAWCNSLLIIIYHGVGIRSLRLLSFLSQKVGNIPSFFFNLPPFAL